MGKDQCRFYFESAESWVPRLPLSLSPDASPSGFAVSSASRVSVAFAFVVVIAVSTGVGLFAFLAELSSHPPPPANRLSIYVPM